MNKHATQILALAADFPRIWNDERTAALERKRMVAWLIEDVTLLRAEHISIHVRFRGGRTTSLTVPRLTTPDRATVYWVRRLGLPLRKRIGVRPDDDTIVWSAVLVNRENPRRCIFLPGGEPLRR